MKTRFLVILLSWSATAQPAPSQEGKPAKGPDKRLQYFVGSWDVTVKFKLPNGEHEGKARCDGKLVLDDKFLHQEYKSMFGGQPLTVWQLTGYDSIQKKYVEFELHSDGSGTHTLHNEGSFSDDGKVLTLAGDSMDGMTGKPVKLRTVTTIVDDDHFTLEWFFKEPGGSSEERKVVLSHTRRK